MTVLNSPILRQSFVTAGVALNFGSSGLSMAFVNGLLEQLKEPNSPITLDVSSSSWVAALPSLCFFFGNFTAPSLMSRYGRKATNLISVAPTIIGWVCVFFANNVSLLLFGRFLQGIGTGLCYPLGTLLIGEYTSPKNRGVFLMSVPVSISGSILLGHLIGAYVYWRTTAAVCGVYSVINMIVILFSPESPGWLIDKERYDESRKVFRWLRGDGEEIELERMIEANMDLKKSQKRTLVKESQIRKLYRDFVYFKTTIIKKEFYKPILIMLHMYAVANWCGANILSAYNSELFQRLNINNDEIPVQILLIDLNRIISNVASVFIIKKFKRRTVFFSLVSVNVVMLLASGIYSYVTDKGYLSFYPVITIILSHILVVSMAIGSVPLAFVVSGEIFPLEYKNLAGGLSMILFSTHCFLAVKTFPSWVMKFNVFGTYCIYAAILSYCLIVTWFTLPETKDRTLQDIEDEFRGVTRTLQGMTSAHSMTSWRDTDSHTKCDAEVTQ